MSFENEPQIFEKSLSVTSPAKKPFYETIKEIEEGLKEKGAKKEIELGGKKHFIWIKK